MKAIERMRKEEYERGFEDGRKSDMVTVSPEGKLEIPSTSALGITMNAVRHDIEMITKRKEEEILEKGKIIGREEAWEAARKIGRNSWAGLTFEMGFKNLDSSINASWDCIMKYSASEVIEKINKHENAKQSEEPNAQSRVIQHCIEDIIKTIGCTLEEIQQVIRSMG